MEKQILICVTFILLILPFKAYSALNRVYDSTYGIISDGAIIDPYKWNDEWANIYNNPNTYLEGMNIASGVIGTVTATTLTGNITGDVTVSGGMSCTGIANSTITGVTYTNVITNLKYTTITSADSPYTAANGSNLLVDTTGGSVEILCPTSPSIGWVFSFTDAKGYFMTNNVTINPNGTLFRGMGYPNVCSGTTQYPDSTNPITDIVSYSLVYGSITSGWVYYGNGNDD